MDALPNESRTVSLWAGVLGAPMLWSTQLLIGYVLVPHVADHPHQHYLFHVVTAVFFLLCLLTGLLCFLEWRRVGLRLPTGQVGGPEGRLRFLAALGTASSALYAIAILAQGCASFFLNPVWG